MEEHDFKLYVEIMKLQLDLYVISCELVKAASNNLVLQTNHLSEPF